MFKNKFKFLIILSLLIILFSQESQAYERIVDSFAGKTTISTKIGKDIGNRIFVDKSINLAFDCVEFSKQIDKNLARKGEQTLDKVIIKSRIDADEKDLTKSLETCAIPDTKKIKVDWFVKTIYYYYLDALIHQSTVCRRVTEGARRATGVTLLHTRNFPSPTDSFFLICSLKKLQNELHTVFYIPVIGGTSSCYKM